MWVYRSRNTHEKVEFCTTAASCIRKFPGTVGYFTALYFLCLYRLVFFCCVIVYCVLSQILQLMNLNRVIAEQYNEGQTSSPRHHRRNVFLRR